MARKICHTYEIIGSTDFIYCELSFPVNQMISSITNISTSFMSFHSFFSKRNIETHCRMEIAVIDSQNCTGCLNVRCIK